MEHVKQTTHTHSHETSGFSGLGIHKTLLDALHAMHFVTPTPIQAQAIPVGIQGKDIVGIAQTGTGKTLALGIPMIQHILQYKHHKGLIVLPTRELALQVNEVLSGIGKHFGLKTAVLIGGASMHLQIQELRRNPHIVIGTPGRINDHLQQKTLHLQSVGILVLDEADHMFDMGFAPQIKKILQQAPTQRQTMLFSATMPDEILAIARTYLTHPVKIQIATQGTVAEKVDHSLYFIRKEDRIRLLDKLLGEHAGSVLVFSRTKHNAKKICRDVNALGYTATEIHSNRSLNQRKEALEGFKKGKYRVLIATDIAARGIDVKGIELVVNYDLPESPTDYVHRIGRTARAGATGKAISFVTADQRYKVRLIEKLIKTAIDAMPDVELPPSRIKSEVKHGGAHRPTTPYRFQRRQGSYGSRGHKPFKKRF